MAHKERDVADDDDENDDDDESFSIVISPTTTKSGQLLRLPPSYATLLHFRGLTMLAGWTDAGWMDGQGVPGISAKQANPFRAFSLDVRKRCRLKSG